MPKLPKKSPSANSRPRPSAPRKSRVIELSGSIALIGALQASVSDPLVKALLSCFAPAFIEMCMHLYGAGIQRWLVYLNRQDEKRERELYEKDQTDRFLFAESRLSEALADPHLPEDEKRHLQENFARIKKARAHKAIKDAFPDEDTAAVSSGSFQGSAAG